MIQTLNGRKCLFALSQHIALAIRFSNHLIITHVQSNYNDLKNIPPL